MLTVIKASHLDHVPTSILAFVQKTFADRSEFFCEEVDLPADLPDVDSALYGPAAGDPPVQEEDVRYVKRPGRSGTSRLCRRPLRRTRRIVVVAGPDDACGPGEIMLYSVYGAPCAPREPGDEDLEGDKLIQESKDFWAEHALSDEIL